MLLNKKHGHEGTSLVNADFATRSLRLQRALPGVHRTVAVLVTRTQGREGMSLINVFVDTVVCAARRSFSSFINDPGFLLKDTGILLKDPGFLLKVAGFL